MNSYYSLNEIRELGFAALGNDVLLSRKASVYSPSTIKLGSSVRIDDFVLISGNIEIRSHVHVAAFAAIFAGEAGVYLDEFSGISSRVTIYASNDDYTGSSLTGPTVPMRFRNVTNRPVHVGRHVVVGASSIVLPGVTLADGSAIGAMSLVTKNTQEWGIYVGVPAKRLKERDRGLLRMEAALRNQG